MSSAPETFKSLRTFLAESSGLSERRIGIVGNEAHTSGYHLGRDRIFSPDGQGEEDYSVTTARDHVSLTNAASAIDIGRFRGIRRMSKFLVAECRADAPDTHDIREIIYTPDGIKVLRWDRERGVDSKPRREGDDRHLTHTHISWYRDSRRKDKTGVFKRFFENGPPTPMPPPKPPPTPTPKGEIVKTFSTPTVPSICTVPKGARLFVASDLKEIAFNIDPGRDMPFLGEPFKGIAMVHRTKEDGTPTGKVFFARMSALKNIRPA